MSSSYSKKFWFSLYIKRYTRLASTRICLYRFGFLITWSKMASCCFSLRDCTLIPAVSMDSVPSVPGGLLESPHPVVPMSAIPEPGTGFRNKVFRSELTSVNIVLLTSSFSCFSFREKLSKLRILKLKRTVSVNLRYPQCKNGMPDPQQHIKKLCLIKYVLDINLYNFEIWISQISR